MKRYLNRFALQATLIFASLFAALVSLPTANAGISFSTTARTNMMGGIVTTAGATGAKLKLYNGCSIPSGVSAATGCTQQWVNYATLTDEFTGQFVQPWVSTFVKVSDISGAIPRPRDVVPATADDAMFIAQSMPWIDPAKEAAAYVTLVRAGFASEVEVIRKRGGNPRDLLEQIYTWRKDAAGKDLVFNSNAAVAETGGIANAVQDPAPVAP